MATFLIHKSNDFLLSWEIIQVCLDRKSVIYFSMRENRRKIIFPAGKQSFPRDTDNLFKGFLDSRTILQIRIIKSYKLKSCQTGEQGFYSHFYKCAKFCKLRELFICYSQWQLYSNLESLGLWTHTYLLSSVYLLREENFLVASYFSGVRLCIRQGEKS